MAIGLALSFLQESLAQHGTRISMGAAATRARGPVAAMCGVSKDNHPFLNNTKARSVAPRLPKKNSDLAVKSNRRKCVIKEVCNVEFL